MSGRGHLDLINNHEEMIMMFVFLNSYEVEEYRDRYVDHPVLGPATQTLYGLMVKVNQHSDGWPFWQAPQKASQRLQEFIRGDWPQSYPDDERTDATPAKLRKAYVPLKSFRTRTGINFEIKEI